MTIQFSIGSAGSPPGSSRVIIGKNIAQELFETLSSCLGKRSTYWIWDEKVYGLWRERLKSPPWPGPEAERRLSFPAKEANKRLSALEGLAAQLLARGADRGSALVAVGGGVTGDMVGFLASIYMRGIPHVQVPTTLLAQVDSSVGGKTGVDLEQGKNLLGSFHQPHVIGIDLQFLETLPRDEFRQGMAEVIKTAMIGDEALWDLLEAQGEALKRRAPDALYQVVASCCRLKARVVELDERESGYRRVLNLGHTVGHALERLSGYQIRHGDAVAMGLVAATKLAVAVGKAEPRVLDRVEKLCRSWDLPVRIPAGFPGEAVLAAMQTDKKYIGGRLHFILPVRIGEVEDVQDVRLDLLGKILGELTE